MKTWNVTAGLVGVLLISTPSGVDSCAIAPPAPVFATAQRPADLASFVKGKLGVLRRSYGQHYLIGAFRILSGVPLTAVETESLYRPPAPDAFNFDPYAHPGLDSWVAARRAVPMLAPADNPERTKTVTTNGLIYSFVNCQEDAFFTAASTLVDLKTTWGRRIRKRWTGYARRTRCSQTALGGMPRFPPSLRPPIRCLPLTGTIKWLRPTFTRDSFVKRVKPSGRSRQTRTRRGARLPLTWWRARCSAPGC